VTADTSLLSLPPHLPTLQEGLHYDVDNRVGVIFNLSDKYMTGTLGILAVGMAPHEMYGAMQVGGGCLWGEAEGCDCYMMAGD
jgi:hypothetical protein